MKSFCLITLIILAGSFQLFAQDGPAKQAPQSNGATFKQGEWYTNLSSPFRYRGSKTEVNGTHVSDSRSTSINLNPNYFVADNIAIGLKLKADWDHYENGYEESTSKYTIGTGLTYANSINNFNYMIQVSADYFTSKYEETIGSNTIEDKWNGFQYGVKVSSPIRLQGNGNVYLSPYASYMRETIKYDGDKEYNNDIRVGAQLTTFLNCSEMACNRNTGYAFSNGIYTQGNSFIGSTIMASQTFNHYEFDDNSPVNYEGNYTKTKLNLNYNYFIVDYVALGVDVMFSHSKDKPETDDFESSQTSFKIGPVVTVHAPAQGALANLFATGQYNFGSNKSEQTFAGTTTEQKDNLSGWKAGIGFNKFFSQGLALVPEIGYRSSTRKQDGTDYEQNNSGIYGAIGFKATF